MFKTKQHVDKHVANIFGPIKTERERNSKGYVIAKLYLDIKEYESAKRYLNAFLTVRDNYAPAYKLLGKIHQEQNSLEKAVAAYKRCLELDEKQNDVLLKVCELHCEMDIDPDRLKYWIERAQRAFPNHEVILKLQEKIYQTGDFDENKKDFEELLSTELVSRPHDSSVREKLIRLFLDTERINEAYEHVMQIQLTGAYPRSIAWHRCVLDVLQEYKKETGQKCNGIYHESLLLCLNILCNLNMEQGSVQDATEILQRLDQTLYDLENKRMDGGKWKVLLQEMKAQLYFYSGVLILKKAKAGKMPWKEATNLGGTCFLVSCDTEPPNTQAVWYAETTDNERKLADQWCLYATYRACQSGYMVLQLSGGSRKWVDRMREDYCTAQGNGKLYDAVFPHSSSSKQSSYLLNNHTLTTFRPFLPTKTQLMDYSLDAHMLWPDNLRHLVWIALQQYESNKSVQPYYGFNIFETLQYSVEDLTAAVPETVSQLDAEVFMYAVVWATKKQLDSPRALLDPSQPKLLPAVLCTQLCTPEQVEWWSNVYKVYRGQDKSQLGKQRLTLQRGLEVIRLMPHHGFSVQLIAHIARTLDKQAEDLEARSESELAHSYKIQDIRAWATHYWRTTLTLIDSGKRGYSQPKPKFSLIPLGVASSDLDPMETLALTEEGNYYLGRVAMEDGNVEEANERLKNVQLPEAAFYQGQMYKRLADEELGHQSLNETDGIERDTQEALLSKARDAFSVTLERLEGRKGHPLNMSVAEEIQDVENRLSQIGSGNGNDIPEPRRNGEAYNGQSLVTSTPGPKLLGTPGRSQYASPSKLERSLAAVSPSPKPRSDQVESQIRAIWHTQDTIVKTLVEELSENRKMLQSTQERITTLEVEKTKLHEQLRHTEEQHKQELKHRDETFRLQQEKLKEEFKSETEKLKQELREMRQEMKNTEEKYKLQIDQQKAEILQQKAEIQQQKAEIQQLQSRPPPASAAVVPPPAAAAPPPAMFPPQAQQIRPVPGMDQIAAQRPQLTGAEYLGSPYRYLGNEYLAGGSPLNAYGYPPNQQYGVPGMPPYQTALPPTSVSGMPGAAVRNGGPGGDTGEEYNEEDYYYPEDDEEGETGEVARPSCAAGQGASGLYPQLNPMFPPQLPRQGMPQTAVGPGYMMPQYPQMNPAQLLPGQNQLAGVTSKTMPAPGFFGTSGASQVGNLATGKPIVLDSHSSIGAPTSNVEKSPINTKYPMTMPQTTITMSPSIISVTSPQAQVVSTNNTTPNKPSDKAPAGKALFKSPEQGAGSDDEVMNDSSNEPDFKPIVTLPEKVDLITGEEGYTSLHEARAKLLRFVDNQWKERGIGNIKILHDVENGKLRIVMRREQVFKVCANHYITNDIKVEIKPESQGKVLTWRAYDYTDDEARYEQFACRFKTDEIASEFKQQFEKAVEMVKDIESQENSNKKESPVKDAVSDSTDGNKSQSLSEMFKPREGQWSCDVCLVLNDENTVICAACETLKPGAEPPKEEKPSPGPQLQLAKGGGFSFGSGAPAGLSGFQFGSTSAPKADENKQPQGFNFGGTGSVFGGSSPAGSSFKFGGASSTTATTTAAPTSIFGAAAATATAAQTSIFGSPAATTTTASTAIFGAAASTPANTSTPVFGGATSSTTPAFGSASNAAQAPVFGTASSTTQQMPAAAETPKPTSQLLQLLTKDDDSEKKTESSATFGGFSFSTKPVVAEVKKEEPAAKPEVVSSTPNPFAGFSFGGGSSAAPSFSSLAATSSDKPVFGQTTATQEPFKGTGSTVFGGAASTTPAKTSPAKPAQELTQKPADHDDDKVPEYEPDVDFKPIVQLPEVVDLKTGEEGEEKLFGERSKLYRMDTESKQWKERGVGEMKILKCTSTSKYRLLMRREQVLKVCANHHIAKDMKLTKMSASQNAWCWKAMDFAEDEGLFQQFAIKFKNEELALKFKQVFEKCQSEISDEPETAPEVSSSQPDSTSSGKEAQSLSDLFKAKDGEWECDTCYVRNKSGTIKCASCETPKPGHEKECQDAAISSTTVSGSGFGGFTFGAKGGFTFGSPAATASTTTHNTSATPGSGFKFGDTTTASAVTPSSGFKFGQTTTAPSTTTSSGFKFGDSSPSKGFSFNKPDTSTSPDKDTKDTQPKTPDTTHAKFGEAFSFTGVTPVKQESVKSPIKSPQSPGGDMYVNKEGEDDHIYFEPIVKLPDNVEISTGEEDEEELYKHRAKLYRFSEGEWKERGLGDVKLLRHNKTKKIRMLMRREQVLKICLNHYVTSDLSLSEMAKSNGKAWTWHAQDYAEGEMTHEHFAMRFKNADIAQSFKVSFECARDGKPVPKAPVSTSESTPQKSTESKADSTTTHPPTPTDKGSIFATSPAKPTMFDKPPSASVTAFGTPSSGFAFGGATSSSSSFAFGSPGQTKLFSLGSSGAHTEEESSGLAQGDTVQTTPIAASSQSSLGGSSMLMNLLTSSDASDDCEVVRIETATPEQQKKAAQYQLPKSFYLYENKTQCRGCIGCDPDNFDFSTIGKPSQVQGLLKEIAPGLVKSSAQITGDKGNVHYAAELSKPVVEPIVKASYAQIVGDKGNVAYGQSLNETSIGQQIIPSSDSSITTESKSVFGSSSVSSGFDFAALANSSDGGYGFGKTQDSDKPFHWQGAGATLFGSSPKKGGDGGDGEDGEVEQGDDIHFEPIVQLPEVVDIKTGEEDEKVIWSHRAKLYRFDSNAWKERGIGEMKILKHNDTGKYRFLMRREQILKTACNHALTADMAFTPLATSETTLCWFAADYAENEPKNEQFALRLKTKELIEQFQEVIEKCQQDLRENSSEASPAKTSYADDTVSSETTVYAEANSSFGGAGDNVPDSTTGAGVQEVGGDDDEDYVTTDEDGEEEMAVMFSKRATMFYVKEDENRTMEKQGVGELQVLYDDDVTGARIHMTLDGDKTVANHVICRTYTPYQNQKGKTVEWKAQDFSTDDGVKRVFKVQFSSLPAMEEFVKIFQEGIEMAREAEIDEAIESKELVFSLGTGVLGTAPGEGQSTL